MQSDKLAVRVKAVNAAYKGAMDLYPKLAAIFEPLVGCQVTKKDGTLLAKVAKMLPDFRVWGEASIYRLRSDYSLAWVVKTYYSVGMWTEYHEAVVYVGNLQNGVLTSLCPPFVARCDYTVAEVEAKRKRYDELKKQADDARSDLVPFGEY